MTIVGKILKGAKKVIVPVATGLLGIGTVQAVPIAEIDPSLLSGSTEETLLRLLMQIVILIVTFIKAKKVHKSKND